MLCRGGGCGHDRCAGGARSHSAAPQIITKEIEASEWKKKYEESRQEVLEMRWDPTPVGCCAQCFPPVGCEAVMG